MSVITAATSSAKTLILQQNQCAGHLKYETRTKYLTTQLQFSSYCHQHGLPWHTSSILYWMGDSTLGDTGKLLATSTLQQKLSHINCLTETVPPLLPGATLNLQSLAHGLGGLKLTYLKDHILPPSFLLALSHLQQPTVLTTAIQFQALAGLRAAQVSHLLPPHLATPGKLWVAPCKHTQIPVILDISHIPAWLVTLFLSFAKSNHTPLVPMTPAQYKQEFRKLTASYGLKHTTHTARHFFASLQRFLNVPPAKISQALIHATLSTVMQYIHAMTVEQQRVILSNPQYFKAMILFA